jgi:hypothetical protein
MKSLVENSAIGQRVLLKILLFGTALIIWNGNLTAIEIKDFLVQIGVIAILFLSLFNFFTKPNLRFPVTLFCCL